jgi:hypothetical protein
MRGKMKTRIVSFILSMLAVLGMGILAAPSSSAEPHYDGATFLAARKCYFSSDDYTWVQIIRFNASNHYYHRIGTIYMGTYTFDENGNRRNNTEDIAAMKVREQSASGADFGVGNDYTFSYRPTVGFFDEHTSTSEYKWIHGHGVYVWTWLKNHDGRTCSVKYLVY